MEFPKRKPTRIPDYDYSTRNYYFITICTHEKKKIFGMLNELSCFGEIAQKCMQQIEECYPQACVDKFVIMPNHVHAIIVIGKEIECKEQPDLTRVIGQYKMSVTKGIRKFEKGIKVWQRSFHDHIIRSQKDYEKIWMYIENNPIKWEEDCFYLEK